MDRFRRCLRNFVNKEGWPCWVGLLLTHHFAALSEIFVHFFDVHAVRLGGDVEYHLRLLTLVEHVAIRIENRGASIRGIGIEVVAQTRDADTAENTENVALMFVELWEGVNGVLRQTREVGQTWRCFAAEHNEVLTEKGLDTSQAQMC